MLINEVQEYLNIEDVNKSFGETKVLHGINLHIKQGEFVAIVGRSGCGKSTLLRLIAGLETPTNGSIRIQGEELCGINKKIRVLFQEARLLPWKRVIDNVKLGMQKENTSIAKQVIHDVGLEEHNDKWPDILSGGQQQRVALARALVAEPEVLLLDEPLGALDALTRIEMQQLIEKLWLSKKFTAILVTHDVSEAVALANRVVFIDHGKIAMDIAIQLSRPRHRNNDFTYYEKKILDKIMGKAESVMEDTKKLEYAI